MIRSKLLLPLLTPVAYPLGFAYGLWQRRQSLWRSYVVPVRLNVSVSIAFLVLMCGVCIGIKRGVDSLTARPQPAQRSALPRFVGEPLPGSGSGTVNTGVAATMAYYPAATPAASGDPATTQLMLRGTVSTATVLTGDVTTSTMLTLPTGVGISSPVTLSPVAPAAK